MLRPLWLMIVLPSPPDLCGGEGRLQSRFELKSGGNANVTQVNALHPDDVEI
jgi:hypothetical protein